MKQSKLVWHPGGHADSKGVAISSLDIAIKGIFDDVARTVEFKKVDNSGAVFPIYGSELRDRTRHAIKNIMLETYKLAYEQYMNGGGLDKCFNDQVNKL